MTTKPPPIHPGEILLDELLRPMGISQNRLAKSISVPPRRINELVHGKRAVTADTALRLSRFFGTSERFWMNLQTRYELEREKEVIELAHATWRASPRYASGGAISGLGRMLVRMRSTASTASSSQPSGALVTPPLTR